VLAAGIVFLKSVKLMLQLYPVRNRRFISLSMIYDQSVSPDVLAGSALANRIRCVDGPQAKNELAAKGQKNDAALVIECARMGFDYLWKTCCAETESIRRLALLTLLATLFVTSYGAIPTFEANFNNKQITGKLALYQALASLLNHFALGILVAAIFYLFYNFFITALVKRRAAWDCFSARAGND
jgi:hypothetical protein